MYALVIARVCHEKVRDESVLPKYRTERCFCSHGIEAYCVKCKAKKEMKDPVESLTKNGKPITKGKCPTAVPRFAVSALRNNLALTDDEKDALAVLFLHYEGVSREAINEDSKGEERSRRMRVGFGLRRAITDALSVSTCFT